MPSAWCRFDAPTVTGQLANLGKAFYKSSMVGIKKHGERAQFCHQPTGRAGAEFSPVATVTNVFGYAGEQQPLLGRRTEQEDLWRFCGDDMAAVVPEKFLGGSVALRGWPFKETIIVF